MTQFPIFDFATLFASIEFTTKNDKLPRPFLHGDFKAVQSNKELSDKILLRPYSLGDSMDNLAQGMVG